MPIDEADTPQTGDDGSTRQVCRRLNEADTVMPVDDSSTQTVCRRLSEACGRVLDLQLWPEFERQLEEYFQLLDPDLWRSLQQQALPGLVLVLRRAVRLRLLGSQDLDSTLLARLALLVELVLQQAQWPEAVRRAAALSIVWEGTELGGFTLRRIPCPVSSKRLTLTRAGWRLASAPRYVFVDYDNAQKIRALLEEAFEMRRHLDREE